MEGKKEVDTFVEILVNEEEKTVLLQIEKKDRSYKDEVILDPDEAISLGSYLVSVGMELGGKVKRS